MTATIFTDEHHKICLDKPGADTYIKISYPLKYGRYSEIETRDAVLQFNLNHEIVRARGKDSKWIQPTEWLKRSMGNDWVYYSTGGYTGVFEATGEYYLPNLPYPTNSLLGGKPLKEPSVMRITHHWYDILQAVKAQCNRPHPAVQSFLEQAVANTPKILEQKAQQLFDIADGRITVMPPDARHVDYDIIPLTISHGCIYKCKFCRVKTNAPFSMASETEILSKIARLKKLYGNDLVNYNGLFLGEHDALNAHAGLILFAADSAFKAFDFKNAYMKGARLFMFGSVDSLLKAPPYLFEKLNALDYRTHINIGLESANQETLDRIGKPITTDQVLRAFDKMQQINGQYDRIEITANFIMDDTLPKAHYTTFLSLVRDKVPRPRDKGSIYLSPLRINAPSRSVLFQFNELKRLSHLPTYLYIIQRL
ncbi:Radical SAM superfamily protein [Desulfocicer vacuolatum DSM 3385]|uniref:Radical SAM superfamily protein n=1 Tax=Desulfocicer vacuolatum DSM 3385 TaxID=1121400 RepID=A0A1W1YLW3_9BACT|nr:radical SAM protein [Desulfocicer vacuolatum]SMC36718.1 Radical SAM superfamily protein [Desulfocicer vacuolatum DSM 3385]